VSTDLSETDVPLMIYSALILEFYFGTAFFKIGIYLALTALSYRPLVKNPPVKLATAMVIIVGRKMLMANDVSITITANEYVILV
jgi:hypothetical protein